MSAKIVLTWLLLFNICGKMHILCPNVSKVTEINDGKLTGSVANIGIIAEKYNSKASKNVIYVTIKKLINANF